MVSVWLRLNLRLADPLSAAPIIIAADADEGVRIAETQGLELQASDGGGVRIAPDGGQRLRFRQRHTRRGDAKQEREGHSPSRQPLF